MAFSIMGLWAEEVTQKQALELAEQFVAAHQTRKSAPTVTAAGQVSGLYVFNVGKEGGFVIVSNDDATTPILGYSQQGSINTDQMPDNMRAWLKGYADQIAWLKANGTSATNKAKAPRRAGNHSTKEIAPLITTKWNQGTPYNNLCPEYESGQRCATGCVATAYAQVMYYTETVTHNNTTTVTTAEIPGYTTRNKLHTMDAIAEGAVIDWSKMVNDYSYENYTEEQAAEVANMMLILGCAVQMNYNRESGAYTKDVALALKTYFDYAETTQVVSRSCYTYANWTDLIYHELSQRRPVVYGGQSEDGGHEFVCDGYLYDGGDLFHINWGWGGMSDGYFVLSILNPNEQGIGGSATSSAFNTGHEAVIGIQKTGDKGTVLDVPTTLPIDLTINSITLSHNTIALGESVGVTVNVTNNNTESVYDGEIQLTGVGKREMFEIPAGATLDCVFNVTPTTAKSYTIKASYYTGTTTTATSSCSASLTVKNQTPTNLTASNVDPTTVTIGWDNVGSATTWNLRSMPVAILTEDFNGTMAGWRLTRATKDDTHGIDGSPCVTFGMSEQLQWLVTPKTSFGGTFSFYAWKSGETAETFSVLYSKSFQTFTYMTKDVEVTSTPTKYTFDIDALSGEGWLAIIHTEGTEGSYLYVDDATIIDPMGEWTTVSGLTTNSYSLTGLTHSPHYEVQVQAVNNDGGKWSTPILFTTANNNLELANTANNNSQLVKLWNGVTANVTLAGRTLYKDGTWNSLCLPFSLTTLEDSPLDGAIVMELDAKSQTDATGFDPEDGTLYLYFKNATTIEAGKPYIIKWLQPENYVPYNGDNAQTCSDIVNPTFSNVNVTTAAPTNVNRDSNGHYVVTASYSGLNPVQFIGSYNPVEIEGGDKSTLYIGSDNTLYWPSQTMSINAFRAYFNVDLTNAPAGVREFKIFEEPESQDENYATAISDVTRQNNHGHTSSESVATQWYDLSGRKIATQTYQAPNVKLPKGVYIANGRLVVVK